MTCKSFFVYPNIFAQANPKVLRHANTNCTSTFQSYKRILTVLTAAGIALPIMGIFGSEEIIVTN